MDERKPEVHTPLSFHELEVEPVQHQLMTVLQDFLSTCL